MTEMERMTRLQAARMAAQYDDIPDILGSEFDYLSEERNILGQTLVDSPLGNIQMSLSYLTPPHLSPDEHIIQLRGRKKISWSPHHDVPLKSPLKTPTKKLKAMVLRTSPRKRLMSDFGDVPPTPESTRKTTPLKCQSASKKKIRFDDMSATSRLNPEIPLGRLLKGLSREQLVDIILNTVRSEPKLDTDIRLHLPTPDLKPLEERLNTLKRNITRSLPKTRLVSKTDGASYSRAMPHLDAFKKCVFEQVKTLTDSSHWDALLDFVPLAWNYVKATPIWDNPTHNGFRKACFKQLILSANTALKHGSVYLGEKRLTEFALRLRSMSMDYDEPNVMQQCLASTEALLKESYVDNA